LWPWAEKSAKIEISHEEHKRETGNCGVALGTLSLEDFSTGSNVRHGWKRDKVKDNRRALALYLSLRKKLRNGLWVGVGQYHYKYYLFTFIYQIFVSFIKYLGTGQ
jgi:hypothetical protein